ncbi:MAG: cobalamin-independent methionine synthase II family protein [Hyphomicrobiales bacterium]|nr:cobalamin-independent methionine synthase II family protein [Hyphomicrobiales bacterium]
MKRSTAKILTTHVGSLPDEAPLDKSAAGYEARLRAAVAGVVARQREIGIDIVNEGEYAKGGDWLSYVEGRFAGFEQRPPAGGKPILLQGRDREEFADFYQYATARGTLFYSPDEQIRPRRAHWACTGPVTFKGQATVQREIDALRAAVASPADAFITSTAPASLEPYYANDFYRSEEEYVFALAEAMRSEYEAIAAAGFLLQVDDAWLVALWDRIGIAMGLDAFRRRCSMRVEALNHALARIPEEQIRYHLCWGSWHGPHVHDHELTHLVDIMLRVRAQAYLVEAANARHEHEWAVWERVKLPAGKIIVPGVITHSTDVVEHPELVSQRIRRFAEVVGRENVIAGADCGFGGRTHPQIAWAKLKSLSEGARLASKLLW